MTLTRVRLISARPDGDRCVYTANPDKKPGVEMEVGLKSGWANLLLAAYNGGSLSVFGAGGARLNVTPELLSTISPTDIIRYETDESGAIQTDEKGRPVIDVIIVPKLGSKETAEATSEAANSTPDNVFSWLGMTDSAKKDASEVASTLTEIERLRTKIAELKETGQASDEEGIPLSDYQSMLTAMEESLYTMLADLDELDLSKIATDMAAIIAAMQTGEIDSTEGMTLLDPYLKLLEASDQYLGVGNDIAAGIAEGLKTYAGRRTPLRSQTTWRAHCAARAPLTATRPRTAPNLSAQTSPRASGSV